MAMEEEIDSLAEKSVMEIVELIEALEERFGVTAGAAVAAAPPASSGTNEEISIEQYSKLQVTRSGENTLKSPRSSISTFIRTLEKLKFKKEAEDRREIKGYLATISAGINPREVRAKRYVNIRVYLGSGIDSKSVEYALVQFASATGFKIDDAYEPEFGSWKRKLIGKSKDILTNDELVERLKKAERALELANINKVQSEIDKNLAEAAATIIDSLKDEHEAAIQLSSLLIVKCTNSDGKSKVGTRVLTQKELIYLENNPSIIDDPSNIIDLLTAVRLTARITQDRKSEGAG